MFHHNFTGIHNSNPHDHRWGALQSNTLLPPEFSIRLATIYDLDELQYVARTTFYTAFKDSTSEEDMQDYLATSFHTDTLTEELQNPLTQYYVITFANEKIVGYAKLNVGDAQTMGDVVEYHKNNDYIQLQRLYIMPEYQSFKLGTNFMLYILMVSKSLGYKTCWLTVWDQNDKAINFYRKFNFIELEEKVQFVLGNDITYDYIMIVDLETVQLFDDTVEFKSEVLI